MTREFAVSLNLKHDSLKKKKYTSMIRKVTLSEMIDRLSHTFNRNIKLRKYCASPNRAKYMYPIK